MMSCRLKSGGRERNQRNEKVLRDWEMRERNVEINLSGRERPQDEKQRDLRETKRSRDDRTGR